MRWPVNWLLQSDVINLLNYRSCCFHNFPLTSVTWNFHSDSMFCFGDKTPNWLGSRVQPAAVLTHNKNSVWRKDWSSQSYTQQLSSCEIKAWKKVRPERDSNLSRLRYRCSALQTELSSHLGLSWSHCEFRPEFFWQALISQLFKLSRCITAMIKNVLISFPAVQIHDLSYIYLKNNITKRCLHMHAIL